VTAVVVVLAVVGAAALAVLTALVTAAGYRRTQAGLASRLTDVMHRLRPAPEASATTAESGPGSRSAAGVEAALAEAERIVGDELHLRHNALVVSDRLAAALSVVPHGVIVSDQTGAVCYRNEAGSAFAGARQGDVLAEVAVNDLMTIALGGSGAEQTLELYGPPRRSLLITARPLHGADDALVGAVAIIEDVSERKRLDSVRRDFVANVSHELKTPVGALGVLAETMQAEDDPVVSRRLAERMHLEAFRVARIIDDLLDLSRIESEEAPVREPVAVHLVVAEAVERIRALADHRHITIAAGEAPKRLTVVGDRRQLVSALHNLLENAVKYSDDFSSVEVDVRAVPGAALGGTVVEVAVSDHGIGIPARDL
jgi:two-component system sensor histidine kinase SenX3